MSELLKQIRASNPVGEELVHMIELVHAGLPNGVIRFARSYVDVVADTPTLSDVTFIKSAINVDFPEKGVTGNQDLLITVDNVSRKAWGYARAIQLGNRYTRSAAYVNAYVYALSDLSAPLESYTLEAKRINCDGPTISVLAGYKELFNRQAFKLRYNSNDHPGLKYQ